MVYITGDAAVQEAALENMSAIKRVCVFRALQIGDMLCAVPAFRALRAGLPQARITLVGLPWAREFANRFQCYIDEFICFPGANGLPEQKPAGPDTVEQFYAHMASRRFDLALQMHGDGRVSNEIVLQFGARVTVGFHPKETSYQTGGRFIAYPSGEPEIRRLLRLIITVGLPSRGEYLEFPVTDLEREKAVRWRQLHGLRRNGFICIHPGARAAARRWLPERFAAVGDRMAQRGLRVVITGSAEELELTERVVETMRTASLNVAGELTIGEMAALISDAQLLICNDTGVSHMAAALRVPSVVVFTASSPQRWTPLDATRHRGVLVFAACRPCIHTECPIGHPCAQGVTSDAVLQAVGELIGQSGLSKGDGRW